MKKTAYLLALPFILFGGSCKKALDINDDPNRAIQSTPELVLPQAIAASGGSTHTDYNIGIGRDLMYVSNAGGVSGFASVISYDYTTGAIATVWPNTYDNVNDYKYIRDKTAGDFKYVYFNAAARIMSSYMLAMLVDQYDNIPYTEALQGAVNISPKYDKGVDIYKDLAAQIDTAITMINAGLANTNAVMPLTAANDPLFSQVTTSMLSWKQFANTVKLRMMVRAGGKVNFNNTSFSADGFLGSDALVNPGYTKTTGKISPIFLYNATNTAVTSQRLPSTYVVTYYDGTKLSDPKRGAAVFKIWPNPPTNQLGNETNPTPPNSPVPSSWFKGTSGTVYDKVGIYKDYTQGVPLITAAESYFLQAEAVVRGYITGDANALFNKGIEASFIYLYKDGTGNVPATGAYSAPSADATAYRSANASSYLVNFSLAASNEQKIEAIITQKYIALNQISMHEAWNEYRRTGYPATTGTGPTQTFVSNVSIATRSDRFPTRFPYPASEYNTNQNNIPKDVDKFKTLIFWAK